MEKYQVKVTSTTARLISLIKSLRLIADLGLGDAKELADFLGDSTPCVLVAGIDREVADHVVELLQGSGVGSIVEKSSLETPMLLCPSANQKYVWHWLSGPTPET